MDIFRIFSFAGGLGLFLFGMSVLSEAIGRQTGGKMKVFLERLVTNKLLGVLVGTFVTAVIQSSGATTVMILGFINSGIMSLENSISLIFGANIGTTATAWILALNDISGSSFLLRLLNPDSFVPLLAFTGAILLMFTSSDRTKDVGTCLLGFSVLMFGMGQMSDAMAPLKESDLFKYILSLLDNPILGLLAGFAVAGILQSSSASVGILQAASVTGAVTVANALPLIMGVNIGAGLIVLLASANANRDARRAAWVYMLHNILAAAVTMVPLLLFELAGSAALQDAVNAFDIALLHTCYKTANTALQLPFVRQIVWLTGRLVPAQAADAEEHFAMLDDNFLKTPPVAVARCGELTNKMARRTGESIVRAVSVLRSYDYGEVKRVRALEDRLDEYEDKIGSYLVKLSNRKLSAVDNREVTKLLHSIGDFERISDHARNMVELADEAEEKKLHYSETARKELEVLLEAVEEATGLTVEAFVQEDSALALRIEPLEQVVDELCATLRARHIQRLKDGDCSIATGFYYTDILNDLERISDHCSNIAVSVLQIRRADYEPHSYEKQLKVSDADYNLLYGEFLEKYKI